MLSLFSFPASAQSWQWGLQSVGTVMDRARVDAAALATDGAGNVYLGGTLVPDVGTQQPVSRTFGTITLTSPMASSPGSWLTSGYLAQASANGQWQWAREFRTNSSSAFSYSAVTSVVATTTGDVYVAGTAGGSSIEVGGVSFSLLSPGNPNQFYNSYMFVARLNSQGVCQWVRTLPGSTKSLLAWSPGTNTLALADLSTQDPPLCRAITSTLIPMPTWLLSARPGSGWGQPKLLVPLLPNLPS